LTQKKAYSLVLKNRKIKPGKDNTRQNIKKAQEAHHNKTGRSPSELEIWTTMNKDPIPMKFRDFIWKLTHNRHKVGPWFTHIPGWEEKATCECGELETMNHILFICQLNKQESMWDAAERFWYKTGTIDWVKPSIDLIKALGAIKLTNRMTMISAPKWANDKYIELISETAWIIWTTRNDRIFNRSILSNQQAKEKWDYMIINKLKTDWRGIVRNRDWEKRLNQKTEFMDKWATHDETITVSKNQENITVSL
jgi:ribonuclease HI